MEPVVENSTWADWTCNANYQGWAPDGVQWCVDSQGNPVDFEVLTEQVDPTPPNLKGEVVFFDGLCAE